MTRTNSWFPSLRPMPPRDPQESHRAATPLELLFDLVSVIAIAAAAAGLHHAIAEAHTLDGLAKFAGAFFAIWWAWMNYTWFASAYDNDDPLFRTLTRTSCVAESAEARTFTTCTFVMLSEGSSIAIARLNIAWLRAHFSSTSGGPFCTQNFGFGPPTSTSPSCGCITLVHIW